MPAKPRLQRDHSQTEPAQRSQTLVPHLRGNRERAIESERACERSSCWNAIWPRCCKHMPSAPAVPYRRQSLRPLLAQSYVAAAKSPWAMP